MIRRYKFGNPVFTDATDKDIQETVDKVPFFKVETTDDDTKFTYEMDDNTRIYGLGEANRGINKRGYRYVSYCTDDPSHTEEKESMYGAHNFILIDGQDLFGLFIDNPAKVTFDLGYSELNKITISTEYQDMNVYIIEGKSLIDIVKQFRECIGRSYVPPKWAFGFGQSRWSYENQDRVQEISDGYEKNDMLLSAIYLDIDYMKDYKDFTVNNERFPDFTTFVSEMKKRGIHLVPIIDAGVKIEEGYDVYEEGVKNNYFVKDQDGKDFVTAVWPGYTHFPDFLNHSAREWFGNHYKTLLDMGIEGFWNDMNEPAIFYTRNGVDQIKEKFKEIHDVDQDEDKLMNLRWDFNDLQNSQKDYSSMYHNMDGTIINHQKVHNLYGFNMTKAAGESFLKNVPDKRILLFSRASYIGMHRYGGIWMGDNSSWWSHILLNLKMLPSLNMCGFLYTGADTGGFGCNATEDLVLRWMALSVFTPLMRNHAAMGTRNQECFRFTNKDAFKNIIETRYQLLPYLYSEFMKAVLQNDMMFKPLAFVYEEDSIAKDIENQLMLGNEMMIAPVYEQNAKGRFVYLPEDMLFVKFVKSGEVKQEYLQKGMHYIAVGYDEVPLFIKKGCFIPVVKRSVIQNISERSQICNCERKFADEDFELIGQVAAITEYRMYEDDGNTRDIENNQNYRIFTKK